MKNRIYLFANFGDWKKQPYGGGEVGNRRTLTLLKKCGYEICLIEKYKRVNNHSVLNLLHLMFKMVCNVCKFFFILLTGRRKQAIVHIVGFYGPMVYFEEILVVISKILGYKTVYEMRGGGAEHYYNNGSKRYRKSFNVLINKCDCVFSQGLENYALIDSISEGKDRFYYPNYVMPDFAPTVYPDKPKDRINLFYFGRISSTKNIDIVLETMNVLHSRYPRMTLSVVGNYSDETYYKSLTDYVQQHLLSDCIKFYPACGHEQLKKYLKDKHFYIFPTSEPHEGHSNAMTEAMAWGLIPIATSQGFNRSVVANADLIVSELSPEAFADSISKIIDANLVDRYSIEAYQRVMDNYCSEKVFLNLKAKYEELFEKYSIDE